MRTVTAISVAIVLVPVAACVVSCVAQHGDELPDDDGSAQVEGATGEAADEILKTIKCREEDRGAGCMMRCAEEFMLCAGGRQHPYSPSSGTGYLGKCARKDGDTACTYYWKNGDDCTFTVGKPTLCKYPGGRN